MLLLAMIIILRINFLHHDLLSATQGVGEKGEKPDSHVQAIRERMAGVAGKKRGSRGGGRRLPVSVEPSSTRGIGKNGAWRSFPALLAPTSSAVDPRGRYASRTKEAATACT
jgi:hypothetical protein